MKKRKRKEIRPAIILIKSSVFGWTVFLMSLLPCAFCLTRYNAPGWLPLAELLLADALGAFLSAYIGKRNMRFRAVLPVVLSAVCYLIPLIALIWLINGFSVSPYFCFLIPAGILGAAVGGLVSAKLTR